MMISSLSQTTSNLIASLLNVPPRVLHQQQQQQKATVSAPTRAVQAPPIYRATEAVTTVGQPSSPIKPAALKPSPSSSNMIVIQPTPLLPPLHSTMNSHSHLLLNQTAPDQQQRYQPIFDGAIHGQQIVVHHNYCSNFYYCQNQKEPNRQTSMYM